MILILESKMKKVHKKNEQAGAELCQALNSNCLCLFMCVSVLSLFKKTPLWVLGCSEAKSVGCIELLVEF